MVSSPAPVRLAVLDDHEVLLDSLASWIGANAPDFDLVLTASTWLELVHSEEFPTELVILDFQLRESVSIEARVRTCRAAGAKVIVLTSLDTPEVRERALDTGVAAFLSKTLLGSHGQELWVTDGTRAGTRMVEDLTVGPAGSSAAPRPSRR